MKNHIYYAILTIVCVLLPCSDSPAQQMRQVLVRSGTGFFVNRGYVITNAHVVEGCDEVTIRGAIPEHKATVAARDKDRDLALLATEMPPPQFAPLRYNIDDLKPGDPLIVIGYPGDAAITGEYKVATAKVENIRIGNGNDKWLFISNVVEHGNSGGPVFDTSGNVIGVVVAKAVVTATNPATHKIVDEQRAGVVITLKTLEQFLQEHGVYSQQSGSGVAYGNGYVEQRARDYIVNVQCVQPK